MTKNNDVRLITSNIVIYKICIDHQIQYQI